MALKKDSKSHDNGQGKSLNENPSQLDFKDLEIKKEIESQPMEVSKGMIMRMDF